MAAYLTYHVQSGSITGTSAGRRLSAAAQPATSGDLGSWARVQGLDVTWNVVEYEAGGQSAPVNLPRLAARSTSPPGPATCRHYEAKKNFVFVDDGGAGLLIHGWPPCGGGRCVAVTRGWEALFSALARERRGSVRIL